MRQVALQLGGAHQLGLYEGPGDRVVPQGLRALLQRPVDEPQLLGVARVRVDTQPPAEQVTHEGRGLGLGVLLVRRGADEYERRE
ncbi:hypothetical protein SMICM304S_00010 [Streptomyces microflavus]